MQPFGLLLNVSPAALASGALGVEATGFGAGGVSVVGAPPAAGAGFSGVLLAEQKAAATSLMDRLEVRESGEVAESLPEAAATEAVFSTSAGQPFSIGLPFQQSAAAAMPGVLALFPDEGLTDAGGVQGGFEALGDTVGAGQGDPLGASLSRGVFDGALGRASAGAGAAQPAGVGNVPILTGSPIAAAFADGPHALGSATANPVPASLTETISTVQSASSAKESGAAVPAKSEIVPEGARMTAVPGAEKAQDAIVLTSQKRWQAGLPAELKASGVNANGSVEAAWSREDQKALLPGADQKPDLPTQTAKSAVLPEKLTSTTNPELPTVAKERAGAGISPQQAGGATMPLRSLSQQAPEMPLASLATTSSAISTNGSEANSMLQASSAESGAGYQNPAAAGADALQKQAVAASAAGLGLRENVANRPTQANGLSAAKTGNSVSAAQSGSTPTAEAQAADDLFFEESAEAAELIANKPQSGVSGAAKPAGGGALPAGSGNDSLQGALQGTPASVGKTPENLDAARLTSAVPTNDGVEVPLSFDELNFVRVADAGAVIRNEAQSLPNQATSGNVTVQVAAEIARNLQNGQTRFQMRFDPPELGRVDVNLKVSADGSVQAHLIVERPETLDMFLRDQRGLERALEAAGLSSDAETLKFSLRDNGGQNPQFGQGGDGQSTGHQRSAEHGNNDAEPEITSSETLSMNVSEGRSGLDIKI